MSYETLVDTDELARHLDDPQWRLFDCRFDLADTGRGARDYRAAHIPGAFYAHLDHDLSSPITAQSGRHPLPDLQALCDWLGRHGIDDGVQVVAYDDSGGTMAVRLWWLLRWLGHPAVAVLDGGWPAWQAAGLACDSEPPASPTARTLPCNPDWHQVVDSDALLGQLQRDGHELLLLDVRTRERFAGDAEPIDPVAGHIPGAINLPLQSNIGSDGRFLAPSALRALYDAALGGHPSEAVVAMCGSGVTACHSLLAMEIAGLHGGRLYAGSWSEWIRDPARPIATGG